MKVLNIWDKTWLDLLLVNRFNIFKETMNFIFTNNNNNNNGNYQDLIISQLFSLMFHFLFNYQFIASVLLSLVLFCFFNHGVVSDEKLK